MQYTSEDVFELCWSLAIRYHKAPIVEVRFFEEHVAVPSSEEDRRVIAPGVNLDSVSFNLGPGNNFVLHIVLTFPNNDGPISRETYKRVFRDGRNVSFASNTFGARFYLWPVPLPGKALPRRAPMIAAHARRAQHRAEFQQHWAPRNPVWLERVGLPGAEGAEARAEERRQLEAYFAEREGGAPPYAARQERDERGGGGGGGGGRLAGTKRKR